jgi:histidine ammonia-lyase
VEELILTGEGLTVDDVVAVARNGRAVALSVEATSRLEQASALAGELAAGEAAVYGLTTGVGALRGVPQSADDADRFNRVTIQSHRTSHGPPLPGEVGRAAMLHRVNTLCRGRSMVRPAVAQAFVDALNDGVAPRLRAIGSVGQSDLPVMAELISLLQQRGLVLARGEALSLLNGNALSVGLGALAMADAARLLDAYDVVGACSLEAFAGNPSPLHPQVTDARPYAGLAISLERMRDLLEGSVIWQPGAARNLQDPLSFRTIPQVLGAARDALGFARSQLEIELNASGDNPMAVPSDGLFISVGNFDITPVAAATDFLRLALAQVMTASCERVQKQISGSFSGISTGLRSTDTPDDALALVGGGAAALDTEARRHRGPPDDGAAGRPPPGRDGGAGRPAGGGGAGGGGAGGRAARAGAAGIGHRQSGAQGARVGAVRRRRRGLHQRRRCCGGVGGGRLSLTSGACRGARRNS